MQVAGMPTSCDHRLLLPDIHFPIIHFPDRSNGKSWGSFTVTTCPHGPDLVPLTASGSIISRFFEVMAIAFAPPPKKKKQRQESENLGSMGAQIGLSFRPPHPTSPPKGGPGFNESAPHFDQGAHLCPPGRRQLSPPQPQRRKRLAIFKSNVDLAPLFCHYQSHPNSGRFKDSNP